MLSGSCVLVVEDDPLIAMVICDNVEGSVANMGHGRAASPSWGIRQHWRNAY